MSKRNRSFLSLSTFFIVNIAKPFAYLSFWYFHFHKKIFWYSHLHKLCKVKLTIMVCIKHLIWVFNFCIHFRNAQVHKSSISKLGAQCNFNLDLHEAAQQKLRFPILKMSSMYEILLWGCLWHFEYNRKESLTRPLKQCGCLSVPTFWDFIIIITLSSSPFSSLPPVRLSEQWGCLWAQAFGETLPHSRHYSRQSQACGNASQVATPFGRFLLIKIQGFYWGLVAQAITSSGENPSTASIGSEFLAPIL